MFGRLTASLRPFASPRPTTRALLLWFLVPASAAFSLSNLLLPVNTVQNEKATPSPAQQQQQHHSKPNQTEPNAQGLASGHQEGFWKTQEGSQFLKETLAKTQGERPKLTSLAASAKDSLQQLIEKAKPQFNTNTKNSDGYFGLASAFSSLVTGSSDNDKTDALDSIMSRVQSSAEQGDGGGGITDTAGFSKLLSILQENSDSIQKVLDDQFGDIDFSYFTPAALWYYLEYEDERKNPSWKRLQHRFHKSIDVTMVEDLNDCLALSELSYAATPEELKEGLEQLPNFPLELIYYQMESNPGEPSHFVAVKREQSWWSNALEVVIVVRGTKTISDAITDALMEEAEYRGGKAHAGILDSGRWLAEQHATLFAQLLQYSNSKSKIQLTLIGHSLGAGAAAIAGMELKDKPNVDVNVVGFGCPALLSKELSEGTADYITTVICDSDVVPRTSGATIANVALDIMEYERYPKLMRDVQHAIDALGEYSPKIATEDRKKRALEYIDSVSDDLKKKLQKPKTDERVSPILFPPGKCVHFYRDGHSISGSISPCTFFGEIDITRTMVDDHLIGTGYSKIFLDLMRVYHDDENFSFDEENEK